MEIVILTALGVGGATVIGAGLGFIFKKITHRFSDIVLAFAAGIMMAAAVLGLILPSIEFGGGANGLIITIIGVFVGAFAVNLMDKFVPHMHKMLGEENNTSSSLDKILLFVAAIAIHNLPEGIAAGVGFGSGNTAQALMIAGGIALQNIPEGMVIIGPMLAAGVSAKKTFIAALFTGLVEVVGTFIGYFAVSVSTAVLPFALAFAGGTMLYIINNDIVPETHAHGGHKSATYALLIGFCVMLISDVLLG